MRARGRIAALSVLLLAPTLAACDSLAAVEDPIAVRRSDGELQVTVCTAITLTSVLLEARAAGIVSQSQTAWLAEGRSDIAAGDVLSSDSPPSGLDASSWGEPDLAPSSELTITLIGENDETLEASLTVPLSGVPTADWLQADGTITKNACN